MLKGYGRPFLMDQEGDAESLDFEALIGLLNINRVDRERARREDWATLHNLIAVYDLENSADRRGAEIRQSASSSLSTGTAGVHSDLPSACCPIRSPQAPYWGRSGRPGCASSASSLQWPRCQQFS